MSRLGSFEGYGTSLTFGNQFGACEAEAAEENKLKSDFAADEADIVKAEQALAACRAKASSPAPSSADDSRKIEEAERRASDAEARLAEAERRVSEAQSSNNKAEMDAAMQRLEAMTQRFEDAQKALKDVKQPGLSDFTKMMIGAGVLVGLLIFVFLVTQSSGPRYYPPRRRGRRRDRNDLGKK
jgi:predicted RNase H-like nuclease (RuvC/YqgF family)